MTITTDRRIATLTGIQPTGELHLGNYAGAIRPLARLAADDRRDSSSSSPTCTRSTAVPSRPCCATGRSGSPPRCWPAGSTPDVHLYRQSRVPAIARLAALLANVTAKGLLNRAHAYKAAVAANAAAGRDPDHGVNLGLYGYPVLMAADILCLDADEVPVGADQAQHLEIAVDLAQQFARTYGAGVLREPRRSSPSASRRCPGSTAAR